MTKAINEATLDMSSLSKMAQKIVFDTKLTNAELGYAMFYQDGTIGTKIVNGEFDNKGNAELERRVLEIFTMYRTPGGWAKIQTRLDDMARRNWYGLVVRVRRKLGLDPKDMAMTLSEFFEVPFDRIFKVANDGNIANLGGKCDSMNAFLSDILDAATKNISAAKKEWDNFHYTVWTKGKSAEELDATYLNYVPPTTGATMRRVTKLSGQTVDATMAIRDLTELEGMALADIAADIGNGCTKNHLSTAKRNVFPVEYVPGLNKILKKKGFREVVVK